MTRPDPLADELRAALEADTEASADDEALLARAIDRAVASSMAAAAPVPTLAPAAPPNSLHSLRPRRGPARVLRYAVPMAAAFVATLAMAAVYTVYRSPPAPAHDPERVVPAAPTTPAAATTLPVLATPPASDGAPTIAVDDLPAVTARPSSSAPTREIAPDPAAPVASAADLFRDANAARRAGQITRSVELYRSLVAHHADTPEAHAARVSLGRLLLDKQGDAAGALAQFDAYLKSSASDRALAEEARLGRALVFQQQGRQEEERRAWQELLERHPDTLHAGRARERLRVLAPESPP
jgi:TolA-binding protein